MEMLLLVMFLVAPAVIAFVATDLDRKRQWLGWST